jgi:hypothetical protein
MLNFSKSTLFVVAAILLAVTSYAIAWWNIEKIKTEKLTAKIELQNMDPVQLLLQETQDILKVVPQPLNQNEISRSIVALNVSTLPAFDDLPRWQKNSRKGAISKGKYLVAIIIDDVGVVEDRSLRAVEELPKEVTLAFLPYGEATETLSQKAYDKGHEIMIHLPMQAKEGQGGYKADPGENALYTSTALNDIPALIEENFSFLIENAVGVNNHMGSQFTEWSEGLMEVFKIVEKEELFFLDSLTTANSQVEASIQNLKFLF